MCVPLAFAVAAPGRERAGWRCADAPKRDVVLLAEDNECVARLMETLLGRRGLRVLRASDGAGCERLFAQHGPRVALAMLDWNLPDTSGLELCARLREEAPALPVLLTSGQDHAAKLGAYVSTPTEFLRKPFLPAQVVARIAALIEAGEKAITGSRTVGFPDAHASWAGR